jgi:hypothetical protein
MQILGYGEDALTLWALQNKLPKILEQLADASNSATCQAFFRPSFGRRGGDERSEFGEFDFILLADKSLYLCESKWEGSSEGIIDGKLQLRAEQILRHDLFKFYVTEWAFGQYLDWLEFERQATLKLKQIGITKPIARSGSKLAKNIATILGVIRHQYVVMPTIKNVLLYLHAGREASRLPQTAGRDFTVVSIDYSDNAGGNFIQLSL